MQQAELPEDGGNTLIDLVAKAIVQFYKLNATLL